MDFTFDVFSKTRAFFKKIIEEQSLEDLNKIPKGFNNNIIWNIGHIIVTEQVLIYKLSGLKPTISESLVSAYMKGTKPEKDVTQKDVNEIASLLFSTLQQTEIDYKKGVFKNFKPYTVSTTGNTLNNVEEALQFALFHEGLHFGYVLALLRAI
ncbi:DinB family protein [Corallibacter sp.]|uniref:DinB family protein n=1 Tax=Corallibacter sp. TaxID=2038084 RepID=UPI003A92FE68